MTLEIVIGIVAMIGATIVMMLIINPKWQRYVADFIVRWMGNDAAAKVPPQQQQQQANHSLSKTSRMSDSKPATLLSSDEKNSNLSSSAKSMTSSTSMPNRININSIPNGNQYLNGVATNHEKIESFSHFSSRPNENGRRERLSTPLYPRVSSSSNLANTRKVSSAIMQNRQSELNLHESALYMGNRSSAFDDQPNAKVSAITGDPNLLSNGDVAINDIGSSRRKAHRPMSLTDGSQYASYVQSLANSTKRARGGSISNGNGTDNPMDTSFTGQIEDEEMNSVDNEIESESVEDTMMRTTVKRKSASGSITPSKSHKHMKRGNQSISERNLILNGDINMTEKDIITSSPNDNKTKSSSIPSSPSVHTSFPLEFKSSKLASVDQTPSRARISSIHSLAGYSVIPSYSDADYMDEEEEERRQREEEFQKILETGITDTSKSKVPSRLSNVNGHNKPLETIAEESTTSKIGSSSNLAESTTAASSQTSGSFPAFALPFSLSTTSATSSSSAAATTSTTPLVAASSSSIFPTASSSVSSSTATIPTSMASVVPQLNHSTSATSAISAPSLTSTSTNSNSQPSLVSSASTCFAFTPPAPITSSSLFPTNVPATSTSTSNNPSLFGDHPQSTASSISTNTQPTLVPAPSTATSAPFTFGSTSTNITVPTTSPFPFSVSANPSSFTVSQSSASMNSVVQGNPPLASSMFQQTSSAAPSTPFSTLAPSSTSGSSAYGMGMNQPSFQPNNTPLSVFGAPQTPQTSFTSGIFPNTTPSTLNHPPTLPPASAFNAPLQSSSFGPPGATSAFNAGVSSRKPTSSSSRNRRR